MRFFLFPKVQSAVQSPDDTPVYLNVYDLTPMNGYIYWAGLGIFHSGIEGSSLSWLLFCAILLNYAIF
jgi:deubiquitinase DESI2